MFGLTFDLTVLAPSVLSFRQKLTSNHDLFDSSTPQLQMRVDNRENLLDAVLNVDGHLEECWIVLRTNQRQRVALNKTPSEPSTTFFKRHQEMQSPLQEFNSKVASSTYFI